MRASSMTCVLNQLEIFRAARRVLVQASGALVLAMDVVGSDDPLRDELQPRSASVAALGFAHGKLARCCKMSRSTCVQGLPYIQI